ncbi:hypothetical protein GE061_018998 [Apolygus lucorum]|uniref:Uncharacterized protein n=1 Tax=Apolygus lucorum TaxID=248454 RepID=A0A6A4JP55_APOLU|nr:hypothetical protein GE061_018998 [Apolygus lucorum]
MPNKYVRQLGARPYKAYSADKVANAVRAVTSKKLSIRKAAERYNIPKNTLVNRLKNAHSLKPGGQSVFSEEEERCIVEHIVTVASYGFPVTTFDVRCIVASYLSRIGRKVKQFKNNFPGKTWALLFLKNSNQEISARAGRKISNKRAALTPEVISEYFEKLKYELEGVPPTHIWNYDETNLVDDPGTSKQNASKNHNPRQPTFKASKAAILRDLSHYANT